MLIYENINISKYKYTYIITIILVLILSGKYMYTQEMGFSNFENFFCRSFGGGKDAGGLTFLL